MAIDGDSVWLPDERAARAWSDGTTWRALQRNGMARDFGWEASARRYVAIYARLSQRR